MKRILMLWLLLLIVCLTGCGRSASVSDQKATVSESSAPMTDAAPPAAPEPAGTVSSSGSPDVISLDRKIVQNAEIKLQVSDIAGVSEKITSKTAALKGYPSDYTIYAEGKNANATLLIRVPSANYTELLNYIVKLGKVDFKREYTNDVTAQYVDLDARVKVLRTEEDSLLAILAKAEKIDDILKIKAQITATRQERESLEGQLKALNSSIAYATISVTLYQPENSETAVNVENLNIFSRSFSALIFGFNALTAQLGSVIVFIFTILPTLALLSLLLWVIVWLRNRRQKNKE